MLSQPAVVIPFSDPGSDLVGLFNYIEDITRWCEDMNFIFEWENNILRMSTAGE